MNQKQSKFILNLLLLCGLLLLLASCSGDDAPENPDPEVTESGDDFLEPTGEIDPENNSVGPIIGDDVAPAEGGRSSEGDPQPELVGDLSNTDSKTGTVFDSAASLDELLEKYPELVELVNNLDLNDRENMTKVYEQMLILYEAEGILGMQTFLDGSGIMSSLGLDATYIDFVLAYETDGWEGAEELARRRKLITNNDELRMLLVLDTLSSPDAESGAEALGVHVLYTGDFEIEIGVPLQLLKDAENSEAALAKLVALTRLPGVARVRVPRVSLTSQNDILDGEGPETTAAFDAHSAGITGEGVKVGVIDPGGFFAFQDLQDVGRIPKGRQLVVMPGQDRDYLNDETGSHGTACAEIIYEMAPDATLYIAHAQSGLELAEAVEWMIDEGVDIINYSAGNISVPANNSTPWNDLVTEATDAGILWVNSSGNFAEAHLYMPFTDEDGNGVHEFPNGEEYFPFVPLEGSPSVSIGLAWVDSWGRAKNDFDLFVLEDNAKGDDLEIVESSRELQDGKRGSYPSEVVDAYTEDQVYYIAIVADGATEGAMLNLIGYSAEFKYSMPEYSVTVPGDSPDALTVGATYWSDDALEPYSSQGPTLDGRDKPEISGPAGVSSTVYQGPFYGTSASAPHVAGAAALVLQANPDLDVTGLRNYLIATSVDLGPKGFDLAYGFGRVDLEQLAEGNLPVAAAGNSKSGSSGGDVPIEVFYAFDIHNIDQGDETGMVIKSSLSILEPNDYIGESGTVEVAFETKAGKAVTTLEAPWKIKRGESFLPLIEQFISYNGFGLPKGKHSLNYTVSVLSDSGERLNSIDPVDFFVEVTGQSKAAADGDGSAQLSNVKVDTSITSRGADGIGISMDLDVQDRVGLETQVVVYFFQDTNSEPPLKDFNDKYATPQGNVATWLTFTPEEDDESWETKLFIPYSELHLAEETRYSLKVGVLVFGEPDWDVDLASSDWVKFRVDTGDWE